MLLFIYKLAYSIEFMNIYYYINMKGVKKMEYAKDEIFDVSYNTKEDKLGFFNARKVMRKIRINKFLSLLIVLGIIFSIINFTLIYCFIEVLNKI